MHGSGNTRVQNGESTPRPVIPVVPSVRRRPEGTGPRFHHVVAACGGEQAIGAAIASRQVRSRLRSIAGPFGHSRMPTYDTVIERIREHVNAAAKPTDESSIRTNTLPSVASKSAISETEQQIGFSLRHEQEDVSRSISQLARSHCADVLLGLRDVLGN